MEDVVFSVYPPHALGGQHVGTSSCGVKAVHPCGLEVVVTSHRSQHKNRMIATDMMVMGLMHIGHN